MAAVSVEGHTLLCTNLGDYGPGLGNIVLPLAVYVCAERALCTHAELMVCLIRDCNGRSRGACHCPQLSALQLDQMMADRGCSATVQIWKVATGWYMARLSGRVCCLSELFMDSHQPPPFLTTVRCSPAVNFLRDWAQIVPFSCRAAVHLMQTLIRSSANTPLMHRGSLPNLGAHPPKPKSAQSS